ncbi:MAG TPA: hypothetical protein VIC85_13415 [Ktedonobacterales bacterium]|jgi:hypothetical protein
MAYEDDHPNLQEPPNQALISGTGLPLPARREIIIVTGIQAAGKSTVARLLAERFARGAHVEGDALQHLIVSGSEGVQEPGEPTGEAAHERGWRRAAAGDDDQRIFQRHVVRNALTAASNSGTVTIV